MMEFLEMTRKWDEQDHERENKVMPLICDLIGDPTHEHHDGRPIWQGDTWRALLGWGEFVLFREQDAGPNSVPATRSAPSTRALPLAWLGRQYPRWAAHPSAEG